MLSDPSLGNYTHVIFDPFTNKEQCRIKLPEHNWYQGSTSDGYIILQTGSELLVFNPLTRLGIHLPSLDPHTVLFDMKITSSDFKPTPKAVFAISYYCDYSGIQRLTFCKPGDESWTDLGGQPVSHWLRDIIIYKEKLCGLTHDSGALCTFDLKKNSQRTMVTTPTDGYSYDGRMYLVKSSDGELLKVHRGYGEGCAQVFKLDTESNKWCRVMSLQDNAIMILDVLGTSRSMCISTRDFPKLKGNCIYSVSYSTNNDGMKVFSLRNGRKKEHTLPLCKGKLAYWFAPCLGVCPMSD